MFEKLIKKLCIGTAQFGLDYGITNKSGRIAIEEIKKIMIFAKNLEVQYLDTAQAYGESEAIIGDVLKKDKFFRIINKVKKIDSAYINETKIDLLEKNFNISLKKLNRKSIDTIMIHDSKDFKNDTSGYLINWLEGLRTDQKVKKIGVSIYDSSELKTIPLDKIDVIQLPLSLYDQRKIHDNTLNILSNANISIHVRSIFLQGLLLDNTKNWPTFFSKAFRNHHKNLDEYLKSIHLNFLEASFLFLSKHKIDLILIGLSSLDNFKEIIDCINRLSDYGNKLDFDKFAWLNEDEIDPRNWKKL